MNGSDFELLRELVKRRSGIVISADKAYLLTSRLTPVAVRHGFASIEAMAETMRAGGAGQRIEEAIVNAMTTNESHFFRDRKPFEGFEQEILPHFLKARAAGRRLRIWCAAASSGQEPYSLAIQLREAARQLAGWRTEIIATDISGEVLEKARSGLYSQFEVQRGMPVRLLIKYFEKRGEMWQISAGVRAMVEFRRFNLLDRMAALGTFDVVFCRNVLIYFDRETKADILARIARQMAPDGVIVLGAAETMIGIASEFAPLPGQRGFYRRGEARGEEARRLTA